MEGRKQNNTHTESIKEFTSPADQYQYYLEDHNTCCLCGTELSFQHKIDYMTLQVIEDADCPSCRIRLRTKEHRLN